MNIQLAARNFDLGRLLPNEPVLLPHNTKGCKIVVLRPKPETMSAIRKIAGKDDNFEKEEGELWSSIFLKPLDFILSILNARSTEYKVVKAPKGKRAEPALKPAGRCGMTAVAGDWAASED